MVPAKSGNREKIGKFVMGLEVGQGKMKYMYLKISCCRVPSQPGNIQHQKVSISDSRGYFFKQLLIFYSLKIPSPDEEREVDLGTFVDQEEGDKVMWN